MTVKNLNGGLVLPLLLPLLLVLVAIAATAPAAHAADLFGPAPASPPLTAESDVPVILHPSKDVEPPFVIGLETNTAGVNQVEYRLSYRPDNDSPWRDSAEWHPYGGSMQFVTAGQYQLHYRSERNSQWSVSQTFAFTVADVAPVLGVKATPQLRKVRPGGRARFAVRISADGWRPVAGKVTVCARPSKPIRLKGGKCRTFNGLAIGEIRKLDFRLRVKRLNLKRGRAARVTFTAEAADASTGKTTVKIRRK